MDINYTFSNEDTETELNYVFQGSRVLCVAGSGSRVIPLLRARPEKLVCVDISGPQLYLTELRLTAVRHLQYKDFCALLGYVKVEKEERKKIFESLILSESAEDYLVQWFEGNNWEGVIFSGKWEVATFDISRLFSFFLPELKYELNSCTDIISQKKYLKGIRNRLRLVFILIFFISICKNLCTSMISLRRKLNLKTTITSVMLYYRGIFKVASKQLIKNNFFYSPFLLGRYHAGDAKTLEIDKNGYCLYKEALTKCSVQYVAADIFEYLNACGEQFDFISMSNVLDYCPVESFEHHMNVVTNSLVERGTVLIRQHLSANFQFDYARVLGMRIVDSSQHEKDKTPFYKLTALKRQSSPLDKYFN
ncbi:DUF3419 family protein [Alteromonas sp. 1_MG-2023]|uniref:DUF3419 family protein n=1 Tax=Alteromonas sp. 1_MG-2023 TaxID=3062669 RepID=UPI0026E2576B|nr:DUF3419 family protein [Alteromonas sp. 1_MG-2023]MDO6477203.1 DUF3419 family protein [Alteromonas sp. 1_MG-2023]